MNTENTKKRNATLYYIQRYGIWIAATLLTCLLPLLFRSGFALSMLSQMGIAIIFALSYNMLLGQGGMLSFGHAVYFGVAGYASVHFLNSMLEGSFEFFPVILLPIFGGLVGLFFGVLIGFVSTRPSSGTSEWNRARSTSVGFGISICCQSPRQPMGSAS